MQAHSQRFRDALAGKVAARWRTKVNAYRGGAQRYADLPTNGGSVTLDLTAASRYALSGLAVVDDGDGSLVPTTPTHFLTAYGNELEVLVGFDYLDGTEPELLPFGWYRITESDTDDYGVTTISGIDRSEPFAAARLERPYVVSNGTNRSTALAEFARSRLPDVQLAIVGLTSSMGLTVLEEGDRTDPWRTFADWAAEDGCEAYFDARGWLAVRRRPDPLNDVPVVAYDDRVAGSPLVRQSRSTRIADVRNVWGVTSENASTGIFRGSAEVTDGSSPIHPGVVGRRPAFASSPRLLSDASAQAMADGLKATEGSTGDGLTVLGGPNPALEPGDIAHVHSTTLGIDRNVMLTRWSLPLDLAGQNEIIVTYETLGRAVS